MIAIALQSGSSGNSIYVEAGGVRLLFDAGISGVQAEKRLKMHGRDIRDVDALIISHDHTDHISAAGIFNRKFGIPVHLSHITYNATGGSLGNISTINHFANGATLEFGAVKVESIPTPHDGADGSAFVLDSGGQRLGILTDLGHNFDGLGRIMQGLDGVFIESNYDPAMLRSGGYPEFLQQRIRGEQGHLSNQDAADLLREHGGRLKWACLSHLSENNNDPKVAMRCHRKTLGERLPMYVASRKSCSGVFTL